MCDDQKQRPTPWKGVLPVYMVLKKVNIFIPIIILLLGCNISPESCSINLPEVYGIYESNFCEGNEYIEIRYDTTYIHIYKEPDGKQYCDTGYWSLIAESYKVLSPIDVNIGKTYEGFAGPNEYRIIFYNFVWRDPEYFKYGIRKLEDGKSMLEQTWYTNLYKRPFGEISIQYDPDMGERFIKRK